MRMFQARKLFALALVVAAALALACGPKKESGPSEYKQSVDMAESAKAATERAQAPAESVAAQAGVVYTCEMDPEVRSDKPGQCPKCGMDLVAKK